MIRLWGLQGARPPHLSEDVLTRAIAREWSPLRRFLANWHLDHCAPGCSEWERSEKASLRNLPRRFCDCVPMDQPPFRTAALQEQ
jgi:hypothetical protein